MVYIETGRARKGHKVKGGLHGSGPLGVMVGLNELSVVNTMFEKYGGGYLILKRQ